MVVNSKKIAALKPLEKRYSLLVDKGLSIRVFPSGIKSWILRIPKNGRVTDITLGRFPDISLAQAKQLARRKQKENELNPIAGYRLKDAFVLWCNLKRGQIVSYKDEKRRLEHYIIKKIGAKQLDEITAPLVIQVVKQIDKDNKRATLKRVLMRLREIMDLAVCAGYIEHNPLSRVSKVFAPVKVRAMPSMDWRDLSDILSVIKNAPPRLQNYLLFSLCTALRPGEVAKLEKSWIQNNDVIVIPASEMKKRRIHRVPIDPKIRELLKKENELSPHSDSKYIFSGRSIKTHISKQSLTKWMHSSSLKNRLVPHGFRSMLRCFLADNGVQFEVAEACLSHSVGDNVYKAYQRSDFLDMRRSVMSVWTNYVFDCAQKAGLLSLTDECIEFFY